MFRIEEELLDRYRLIFSEQGKQQPDASVVVQIEQQFVVAHRMHDPSRQPPFGRVAGERPAMLFSTVCRERLHAVVIEFPPPAGKNDVLVTEQ